jgi:AcrR family transcriptional regulator
LVRERKNMPTGKRNPAVSSKLDDSADRQGLQPALPYTADGRIPGDRGLSTRRRILAVVRELAIGAYYKNISVIEIARLANTSPATFYHYFPDVPAALTEVIIDETKDFDTLVNKVEVLFSGELPTQEEVGVFVEAFFTYWEHRSGLLLTIDLASEEEEPRLWMLRHLILTRLVNALARGVKTPGVNTVALAGSLVMMMTHVTARRQGFSTVGVQREDLVAAATHILHAAMRPPA